MGRSGRGSIYIFASGNGADKGDDCNFDGYANAVYTIPIGALGADNVAPWYSEGCAALVGVTYSSNAAVSIVRAQTLPGPAREPRWT